MGPTCAGSVSATTGMAWSPWAQLPVGVRSSVSCQYTHLYQQAALLELVCCDQLLGKGGQLEQECLHDLYSSPVQLKFKLLGDSATISCVGCGPRQH